MYGGHVNQFTISPFSSTAPSGMHRLPAGAHQVKNYNKVYTVEGTQFLIIFNRNL